MCTRPGRHTTASASSNSASRRLPRHRYTSPRNAASTPNACSCPSWPAGQDILKATATAFTAKFLRQEPTVSRWPPAVTATRGQTRKIPDQRPERLNKKPRDDFSWKSTPVIVEWERGDFDDELVGVSHEQASKIIEYFRQK